MAQAPQVQSLAQIMADLAPAYEKQTGLIQQQQAGLGAEATAATAQLDAMKAREFNTINTNATNKGMAFSGIPIDEQATYLSTDYLPAVANLQGKIKDKDMALQQQLADIYNKQYTQAFGERSNQTSALNSWNMQLMQQEAAAREAEKNRAFEASQNSMNRAASAPKSADRTQVVLGILGEGMGNDGYVSPGTFRLARDAWVANGGSYKEFTDKYWNYTGASSSQYKSTNRYKAYL